MNESKSMFEKGLDPVYQAAILLISGFVIMAVGSQLATEAADGTTRFPWLVAAAFLLVFALFNALLSLTSANVLQYWGRSIYSFLGLALSSGLLAWWLSGLSINAAGSYRWIFGVVTFGYLVFLTLIGLMRRIVDFAQKEEWNHPRIRKRK